MGFNSAMTHDMEVFSAAQQRWLEVSSVSNFETYQANRLKLRYKNKEGKMRYCRFYNGGFKRQKIARGAFVDSLPNVMANRRGRNSLTDRIKAKVCEYCGANDNIEMHHVRKLKDLKGRQEWERRMIARKRKTLAVCSLCHDKLHAGRLD